ncbi:hypothetical protein [Cohnella silvisoli]|uniref:SprT-like domain-containing protein n=1 Tax=Cohnella silvisoli TaxID=2873699 RepID=A0ABV1KYP8_9BACL|nr:hypothetical protein [Cohnella silvisoli]MCD9024380.1 hypothetical protein [Cohnella silvisoli]
MSKMSGNLSLDELYVAANLFCLRNWGVPFTGNIELIKRRWAVYMALYVAERKTIRMSSPTNNELGFVRVIDNLHHELVHWRLHMTGQPYDDCDYEFIAECVRVGASLSGAKNAKRAMIRWPQIRAFEERTGRRYEETVAA